MDRFRFRVHGYCLLGNHYHAIIQTPEANLSQGMQWLGLAYSAWFNARHDRVGHLFQGRFKSVPVEEGAWAFDLSVYVHLNPVMTAEFGLDKRGKKVEGLGLRQAPTQEEVTIRLKRLREYPWSSYRAYAGYTAGPKWLETDTILRGSARKKEERKVTYRTHVQEKLRGGGEESRFEMFRDVLGIGSAEFIEKIRMLSTGADRETEHRGRLREGRTFEEVVVAVEEHRNEPAGEWMGLHGDWGKWMVVKCARQYTGLTLAQIGARMGGADYAAIGMGLRRFEQRLATDRALRRRHTEIVKMLYVKM